MSETSLSTTPIDENIRPRSGEWRRSLRIHVRKYPIFWIGVIILAVWVLVVLFAPQIAPYDPLEQSLSDRLEPPSALHPFGTDELGRDIFSRVVYGAQISLPTSFIVVIVSVLVGSALGAVSGFMGGFVGGVIMRVADVTLAFPSIVLALAISAFLGPSLTNAAIAACIVVWPSYARLMRSQVMVVRSFDYVTAARSIGAPEGQILVRHVLPNSWTPIIVTAALDVGNIILLVSALSFLGLGVAPPTPEWGAMISLGRTKFYQWWLATFPGLAILTVIFGSNLLSEGLREWLDPTI
ncbi:MAG: ABC transporter permease [Anaerolineae bacterium]|nr:ABC transporter permease [Anaerolineae bacterium]